MSIEPALAERQPLRDRPRAWPGRGEWLYAAICAAGFVFIFLRLPETKNKTLETIEKEVTYCPSEK